MTAVAHAGFTLEREYPVSVEQLWAAFAEEKQKRAWFGDDDSWDTGEWRFEFRVGGLDVAEGRFHNGVLSRYEARYTDIIPQQRIISSYDMWVNGAHISTSIASYEFESTEAGARLTHTEHGIHLDGFDDGASRRTGTLQALRKLGAFLTCTPGS